MKPPLYVILNAVILGAAILMATAAIPLLAQGDRKPIFISPDELHADLIIAGPPSADSKQTASDLAELHRLQDARTPAQIERAQADDAEEDIFIFKSVLGDRFTKESLPLTALLSGHMLGDEGSIVNPAKDFFRRQRPYRADTALKPVCKVNAS